MAKVNCRADGIKGKGRLKKGFRWAKGRKKCAIKAKARKGKPWSTSRRMRYGRTQRISAGRTRAM